MFSILSQISELTSKTTQALYTEVLKLDKTLDDYHKGIPPYFKIRSITQSIIDKSELISSAFGLHVYTSKPNAFCISDTYKLATWKNDAPTLVTLA
jgi:hypothetical protein